MSFPSARRVVLMTGCSEPNSLGAGLARAFLAKGFIVYATARKVESMKQLAAEGCQLLALDVVKQDTIDAAAAHVAAVEGRLDVLINNAGIVTRAPLLEVDTQGFSDVLDVNVLGPVRVTKTFAPLLLRTANHPDVPNKLARDTATVVNVGSVAAWGTPWQTPYAASKAALHGLSEAMHLELKGMGVNVITVKLGMTSTAMLAGDKSFHTRLPDPIPGAAANNYDQIVRQMEAKRESDGMKGAMPTVDVAKEIADAATAKNPPAVLWTGSGAWIFRYVFHMIPYGIKWKLWSGFGFVDQVKRPVVGDLLVLGSK